MRSRLHVTPSDATPEVGSDDAEQPPDTPEIERVRRLLEERMLGIRDEPDD